MLDISIYGLYDIIFIFKDSMTKNAYDSLRLSKNFFYTTESANLQKVLIFILISFANSENHAFCRCRKQNKSYLMFKGHTHYLIENSFTLFWSHLIHVTQKLLLLAQQLYLNWLNFYSIVYSRYRVHNTTRSCRCTTKPKLSVQYMVYVVAVALNGYVESLFFIQCINIYCIFE